MNSVELNLANSIVVTPLITAVLKRVLVKLQNGEEQYICNGILDRGLIAHFGLSKNEFYSLSELQQFIENSLKEDPSDGKSAGNSTLFGWLIDVYEPIRTMVRPLDTDIVHMGREAWLAKLLYLIEEKGAVRLYTDGSYLDADWRYLPNGTPGWMRNATRDHGTSDHATDSHEVDHGTHVEHVPHYK